MTENTRDNSFNILAIDGGGIRGVFPAHILHCMSSKLQLDIFEQFQMFAGTSTGSIIAAGLACGIKAEEILGLYKSIGEAIFDPKFSFYPGKFKPGFHSVYKNEKLKNILREVFQDKKLGEISKPLLIPASDLANGGVHVFKSNYSTSFNRDKDVYVRDAVAASCSAPTFFDPYTVNEYLIADGGLWANNPSLCSFIDAQKRLDIPINKIKIFSLGTGHSRTYYGVNSERKWGLINGWKGKEFISFILSLQSQSTQNYLSLMVEDRNYLRLDFESDLPLPLDDVSAVPDLVSRADKVFTHRTEDIKNFLNK